MKHNLIVFLVVVLCSGLVTGQTITDPASIDVYITPYYNSKGPVIEVGPFSSGLAAKNESRVALYFLIGACVGYPACDSIRREQLSFLEKQPPPLYVPDRQGDRAMARPQRSGHANSPDLQSWCA
jgi:hypothetical protein